MRTLLFILSVLVLVAFMVPTGCSDKRPEAKDSIVSDSDTATSELDSVDNLIASQPMPKAADELFDDFIFNYAANRRLQLERTAFPLKVVTGSKVRLLPRRKWRMEHFFMGQGYYTILFDNKRQMNLSKDTSINKVTIEKIHLGSERVEQFNFNRINGKWMLTDVCNTTFAGSSNASFLKFYSHFAVDSAFQAEHIASPFIFTGPDPTNDEETMTGTLYPEQWPMFKPDLPHGMIYNVIYGQKYTPSSRKIFTIRGISNSLEQRLTFNHRGGKWKLTKLEL